MMSLHPFERKVFDIISEKYQEQCKLKERLKSDMVKQDDPAICLKNGIRFLEKECSLLFGYSGEFYGVDGKLTKGIPTTYDSALISPLLLNTGINNAVQASIQQLLKNDQREFGFANFLLRDNLRKFQIFPEDIDDTGLAIMSLYLGKTLSREECLKICEQMSEKFMFDNEGQLGTFFKPSKQMEGVQPTSITLFNHFSEYPRIDIACSINCFWLFGSMGLDEILKSKKFQPTMKMIWNALTQIELNEENITHARYYTNPNIILFMLSRFLIVSKFAEEMYKEKLVELIIKKLESNLLVDGNDEMENKVETVIDIACQILSAINLNLHSEGDAKENVKIWIKMKMENMLNFQLPDGSFPRTTFYKWAPLELYAVSKAVSTAFAIHTLKLVLDLGIGIC